MLSLQARNNRGGSEPFLHYRLPARLACHHRYQRRDGADVKLKMTGRCARDCVMATSVRKRNTMSGAAAPCWDSCPTYALKMKLSRAHVEFSHGGPSPALQGPEPADKRRSTNCRMHHRMTRISRLRKMIGYHLRSKRNLGEQTSAVRLDFHFLRFQLGLVAFFAFSLASGINFGQCAATSHRPNSIARANNDAGA